MNASFQKATKKKAKLRAALFGPSGSGKTFTALRIATGLGGKIAFIDTERKSACKYSDRFAFDVCELDDKSIGGYCAAIVGAVGFDVLVIDSLSHGWQELLEQVEKLAQAKFRGNTWSAWSEGTPLQRQLVDTILDFPGHVIATMRSKTEWTTAKQDNGKAAPVRVGLAPEQGKGIEYEFDLLLEITIDHVGNVLKDRTGKYQDKLIDKPGEDFGKSLADWLNEGEEVKPKPTPISEHAKRVEGRARAIADARPEGLSLESWSDLYRKEANVRLKASADSLDELTIDQLKELTKMHDNIITHLLANIQA